MPLSRRIVNYPTHNQGSKTQCLRIFIYLFPRVLCISFCDLVIRGLFLAEPLQCNKEDKLVPKITQLEEHVPSLSVSDHFNFEFRFHQ